MSGTAWGYVFVFAVVGAVLGFVFELFNRETGRYSNSNGHPVAVGVATLVVALLLNWALIYLLEPYFSWWSTDGYPLLFFADLVVAVIACCVSAASTDNWNGAGAAGGSMVVLLVIWGIILAVTPPAVLCDNSGYKQMAGMLQIKNATTAYPDVDLTKVIRVPESVALSDAGNVLSSNGNTLGSYLAPNRAYLQIIQGVPSYVVDLQVTDWRAFDTNGGVIPGYVLVNAVDPSAPPQLKLGYQIHYAPGAWWGQNLDRRVYMDFVLGTNYQIQDLDGMEVDDNYVPHYVGTVVQQVIGYQGKKVVGLYDFDPQAGTGKFLTLDQKPAWLERVYPVDYFQTYLTWWGNYHNHMDCQGQGSSGQEMIDRANAVTITNGMEYQVTMTSTGNDPSLTHLITVEPTTGQTVLYPYSGKTLESIAQKVQVASKQLNAAGYIAEGGQILRLLNRDVAYYILTSATNPNGTSSSSSSSSSDSSSSGNTDYAIAGYAFADIQAVTSGNVDKAIAVGKNFDDAYAQFEQNEATANMDVALANTKNDVQITGIVIGNMQVASPSAQDWSFLISVQKADGTTVYLLAPGSSLNAAVASVGKTVTATCYQLPSQTYFNVRHLVVAGVPDMDK